MKRLIFLGGLVALLGSVSLAASDQQFIVRVEQGPDTIEDIAARLGLTVVMPLDASAAGTYLVSAPDYLAPETVLELLRAEDAVSDAEADETTAIPETLPDLNLDQSTVAVLNGLTDSEPVEYFGSVVWNGYKYQPATEVIALRSFQYKHKPSNRVAVAIIDTGIDPSHPALQGVVVPGYDFTRETVGIPSELSDLDQSTVAVLNDGTLDQSTVSVLNQSTVAVLNQPAADALATPAYAAFGHGTMVAGLVHLVHPKAWIMPLKAFEADGTALTSNIVRAIYYAVSHGANVINMSFSLSQYSPAVMRAINFAARQGVVCVSSAGNRGESALVYPASFSNVVGVAATTISDTRAPFSNFGEDIVRLAAPGEALVTSYPGGTYAAVWGTSFAAGLVSGAAAALLDPSTSTLLRTDDEHAVKPRFVAPLVAEALSHGKSVEPQLGYGRLHLVEAVKGLSGSHSE